MIIITSDIGVQKPSRFMPWLVWTLSASFFFFEYVIRVAPGVMASSLMHDLHTGAFVIGLMSAAFYYPYVGMQLPVGMLVDRFGPHKLLIFMAFFCAISCFIFGSASNVFMAALGRFLLGFCSAFAFVSALKLAVVWFPPEQFPLLAGLTQAVGMFGGVVGEAPMSYLVRELGWRQATFACGMVFLVLCAAIGLWVKDSPNKKISSKLEPMVHPFGLIEGLLLVLRSKLLWINALYGGFLFASTAAFAELWGVTYLTYSFGMTQHEAAQAVMMIFIGWGIGGPLMGLWASKIQNVRAILFSSAVFGAGVTLVLLYSTGLSKELIHVLLFSYGLMNSALIIVYAKSGNIEPKALAGTSMAFSNMASVIVGSLLQPLIGWLLDRFWTGEMDAAGFRVYSPEAMHSAFVVLPVCFVIAAVLARFLPRTMSIAHLSTRQIGKS